MPRRKTSLKSQRASKKRRLRNLKIKQQLKKTVKKFQALLSDKNIAEAKTLILKLYSQLDKAAKKQVIPMRTANRTKSRLTLRIAKTAAPENKPT